MADEEVLDQDEIDSLLGSLSGEESGSESSSQSESSSGTEEDYSDRQVKAYNFKRPDKFSKDQIRTLQMIHETFARSTTTDLSAQLRSLASLSVASVDQLSYEEFMKVVPNPTTMGVVDMAPLEGKALLEMDPALVFQIVDRLFGGTGDSDPAELERELTDIEHSVIERIFMNILNNLRDAWEGIVDLRPRLEQIESNPQFVQVVPPNDMVVLITFDTKIGNVEGMTNLCIPYVILGPVVDQLSATHWYGSTREGLSKEQIERLREKIDFVEVPVSVRIGKARIEMEDLVNLEEGDVLKLDTDLDDPFKIFINDRPKFDCRPGKRGAKMAVQVLQAVEEEQFVANLLQEINQDIKDENEIQGEAMQHGG